MVTALTIHLKNRRFNKIKFIFWLWQDSNLQSSDPKSDALSIRPHNLWYVSIQEDILWFIQDYGEIDKKYILAYVYNVIKAKCLV